MKIKINKKTDVHRESLERRITYNEEYLESFEPNTDEYEIIQKRLLADYDELRKMDDAKIKAKDVLPWLTLAVTAIAGIFVPMYGMNKAYRSEEEEGKLKNGTVFNLATKNMKH